MKTEAITNASLAMLSPMQSRPPCYLSKVHQLFTIVVLIRHSYWFPSLLGITCCSSLRLYLVRVSVTEKRNQLESKAVHITGYSRTVFETVSFLSIFLYLNSLSFSFFATSYCSIFPTSLPFNSPFNTHGQTKPDQSPAIMTIWVGGWATCKSQN